MQYPRLPGTSLRSSWPSSNVWMLWAIWGQERVASRVPGPFPPSSSSPFSPQPRAGGPEERTAQPWARVLQPPVDQPRQQAIPLMSQPGRAHLYTLVSGVQLPSIARCRGCPGLGVTGGRDTTLTPWPLFPIPCPCG